MVWGCALALVLGVMIGCGGGGGGGAGGGEWLDAGLARSVDEQFGPVTAVASNDPKAIAAGGGGSHEATQLQGAVNPKVILDAAANIASRFAPRGFANDPVRRGLFPKPGIGSPLLALALAAGLSSDPCRQDSDNDGMPDYLEDKCDPVTDPNCTGLCFNPGPKAAECSSSAAGFTVKFSDCQVNVTTFNGGSWISTRFLSTLTTFQTLNLSAALTKVTTTYLYTAQGCSHTTTRGTVGRLRGWNTGSPGTADGVAHDVVLRKSGSTLTPVACAFWNPASSTITSPFQTWFETMQCASGSWADLTTVPPGPFTRVIHQPGNAVPVWAYLGGTLAGTQVNPLRLILNGSVTLHNGQAGVDEQALGIRYDNFTQLWSRDEVLDTGTDPFLTFNGQTMDYRVLDAQGNPVHGTTWGGAGKDPKNGPLDGMEIDRRLVVADLDGEQGPVWETATFRLDEGRDNEDGLFVFSAGSAMVSVNDKHGSDGIHFAGKSAAGKQIWNLSFFEKGNGEADKCGDPQNEPCRVTIELDPKARILDVTAVSNCQALDTGDIADLTGLTF